MDRIEIKDTIDLDGTSLGEPGHASDPARLQGLPVGGLIQAVTAQTSQETLDLLQRTLQARAEKEAVRLKERHLEESAHVEASAHEARKEAHERRPELEQKMAELASSPAPDGLKIVVNLLAALAGLGTEFALTLPTLPWALSVSSWTLLGICLAVGPSLACLSLHEALDRLFPEGSLWRSNATGSPLARTARLAFVLIHWTAVAAIVFYMLAPMAPVREEASRVKRLLLQADSLDAEHGQEIPTIDMQLVSRLVSAVTYAMAVTTAVFYTLGMRGFFLFRQRRRLKTRLSRLEHEQRALDHAAAHREAAASNRRQRTAEIDTLASLEAKSFLADQLLALSHRLDSVHATPRTAEQRVEALLSSRSASRTRLTLSHTRDAYRDARPMDQPRSRLTQEAAAS